MGKDCIERNSSLILGLQRDVKGEMFIFAVYAEDVKGIAFGMVSPTKL